MTSTTIHLLDRLDGSRSLFGPGTHKATQQILSRLAHQSISDVNQLIRLHETLLFLQAYPQSARVRQLAADLLRSFDKRIAALREAGSDLSALETPEVSGISGMAVTDTFSYPIVRWLVRHQPGRVALDWDWFEDENRLAETWPRFMPLLEEDAFVEANIPYKQWLREATGRSAKELFWLMRRFESLRKPDNEKAELYDSQKLYVRWLPPYRATRTGLRLAVQKIFYHRNSLIQRKEIFLQQELEKPSPLLERLTAKRGEAILDMAREASTVRYRELYGFTHGDAERVFKTNVGRGVDIFIIGVPPNRRLPLRAYHAAMIFKNGVPVGYFEGISLFERMESGFNLYYSFRDGETAWLYARVLNIFRHLLGVTAFSIDPYQAGYQNEEGIDSGAFWFYRKLGFRPTRRELVKLTLAEEKKIAARQRYRTPAKTLRQLAEGYMIFELSQIQRGDWDDFQVRKIGLAVQRRMAGEFAGDAERIRQRSIQDVTRALDLRISGWKPSDLCALGNLALVVALIPNLSEWRKAEKNQIGKIIRAKASADESRYLRLLQSHDRLRAEIIRLGT